MNRRSTVLAPLLGFIVGAALTLGAWSYAKHSTELAQARVFGQLEAHVNLALDRILGDLGASLLALRALVERTDSPLDDAALARELVPRNHRMFASGLQYLALLSPEPSAGCARAERAAELVSATSREGYVDLPCLAVTAIHPLATNESLLGLDFRGLPGSENALVRAVETGYIAFTPPLPQGPANVAPAGMLAFLPVYRGDESLASIAARRGSLRAVAVAAFSIEDLMRAELGGQFFEHTLLRIDDLGLAGRPADPAAAAMVLDGRRLVRPGFEPGAPDANLSRTQTREYAGRSWKVMLSAPLPAGLPARLDVPGLILLLGGATTALLTLYLRMLTGARQRSEVAAQRMTRDLRTRETLLRQALDAASMGTWQWDASTGRFDGDARARSLLDLHDGALDSLLDHADPVERPLAKAALDDAQRRLQSFFTEFRIRPRTPGSSIRWIELSGQLAHGADGVITGATGLVRDVTERNQLASDRRELLRELVTAEEKERGRIARELHDQLGQEITALSLGLGTLQTLCKDQLELEPRLLLSRMQRIVTGIDRRVDEFMLDLRPVVLDDLGLEEALKAQFAQWSALHGIHVNSHITGLAGRKLPFEVATTAFRLVQESLTNVAKHSGASTVDVIVDASEQGMQVVVEDNGRGQATEGVRAGSYGLAGMRERVESLGGQFRHESTRGSGFSVFARLPLARMLGSERIAG